VTSQQFNGPMTRWFDGPILFARNPESLHLRRLHNRPAAANLDYGLPAPAAEVVNASGQEKPAMKCTIAGCPGVYEPRTVVHTVKHQGDVMVIDHVPAEVCNVCGDVLFAPETVRRIEALLKATPPPSRNVPLYEFA
jgi:YgiT-type zinc finger domain-containing protein